MVSCFATQARGLAQRARLHGFAADAELRALAARRARWALASQAAQSRAFADASKPPKSKHSATGGAGLAHGGMPDFVEQWSPTLFRQVGYGFAVAAAASWPLALYHELSHLAPIALSASCGAYWAVGLSDLKATRQSLRQNFPVLIHVRYLLESIRPEIQQYFVQADGEAVPFSRAARSVVYQRSKKAPDTRALGTKRKVYAEGFEWVNHSLFPFGPEEVEDRIVIGGPDCRHPYSASILNISAMSYGALSGPAIEALNRGAAMGDFYHNTGEGGISRFHLTGADICWNMGTGYFACGTFQGDKRVFDEGQFVSNALRPEVKMVEIKLSQGAKPAHGGILPASKITAQIAEARGLGAPPYKDCVSPPRHAEFKSPVGLMRFITRLRDLSGGKPVGFKLCVGQPEELAALVHAMLETGVTPDFITVDGTEGGTGAAPPEFQDSVGMPLQEGLRLTHNLLLGAGLRERVKIIAAGKVYNGFSLVRLLALGADATNAARAMMFSLGCIQALKCNSNKCPTGITTQDPALNSALDVETKAQRVRNFHDATVHAACEIIGAIGVRSGHAVQPNHLMRRVSTGDDVRSFAQIGERVTPGQLVDSPDTAPVNIRRYWTLGGHLNKRLRV